MLTDDLPIEYQDCTPYCHSCGTVRAAADLGTCPRCGAPLCRMDGCSGRCECDDVLEELRHENAERRLIIECCTCIA